MGNLLTSFPCDKMLNTKKICFLGVLFVLMIGGVWRSMAQNCPPKHLPYFEDFENGFFSNGGGWGWGGADSTFLYSECCWTQCNMHVDVWATPTAPIYIPPDMVLDQAMRLNNQLAYRPRVQERSMISPPLEESPTYISFSAVYSAHEFTGSTLVDTTFESGLPFAVGYVTMISDTLAGYVPIDTLYIYSIWDDWDELNHPTVCTLNLLCKGITIPPPHLVVFRLLEEFETWDGIVEAFFRDITFSNEVLIDTTIAYSDSICVGQPYSGYGFTTSGYATPGIHTLTRSECTDTAAILHSLTLTVLPEKHTTLFEYISPDESVYHDGVAYSSPGDYTFTYTSSNGCDSVVEFHILYHPDKIPTVTVWLPNAFTPNRNGVNSIFRPVFNYLEEIESYSLEIYNRWGGLVFRTEELSFGWDGANAPEGVYTCVVRYKPRDGKEKIVKGSVTLIR